MIPNLLAQAVVLNLYIDRIKAYHDNGDQAGIAYVASLIFRKVFIYKMPEDDLDYDAMLRRSEE